jgi:alkylation response protein AidB-like acyl-CoA dehydrogenase
MLLIPRCEGITTRKIEIGAGGLSATTYVTFEDVKVPARYLMGQEGQGFKYTMSNFNHERLWIAFQALRGSRTCLQDTMEWCKKREAFGKTLIEQPVVRHKFGHMARQIDALQSWTESIIYELDNMSHAQGKCSHVRVEDMLTLLKGRLC